MDWNLFRRGSRHLFLRNELAYKNQIWFYYFAMVINLILRFSWFIYFFNYPDLRLRGFIVSLLEAFRRWQWNFIRVESEHVGNVDGFRVTRDVPLPYTMPQTSSTLPAIVADEGVTDEEGVAMRGDEGFKAENGTDPVSLGTRRSTFDKLLPGEVGRKLKSIIFGTRSIAADESDDEDSPATDSAAHKRRGSGGESSPDEGDLTDEVDQNRKTTAHNNRDKNDFRNNQTLGYDSEIEIVRTPERVHTP